MNSSHLRIPKYRQAAAELIYTELFQSAPLDPQTTQATLARLLMDLGISFSDQEKTTLRKKRPPPELVPRLIRALGEAGLVEWASQNYPSLTQQLGTAALQQIVVDWLTNLAQDEAKELYRVVIQHQLKVAGSEDQLKRSSLGIFLSQKEALMNPTPLDELVARLLQNYFFDTGNALPASFENPSTQAAYIRAVGNGLARFPGYTDPANDHIVAAIIGTLLRLGRVRPEESSFEADINQAWAKLYITEPGNTLPNNQIYKEVEIVLRQDRLLGQPAAGQPAAVQPAAQPGAAQPAAVQPGTAQPAAATQPAIAQPATAQPGAAQPAALVAGQAAKNQATISFQEFAYVGEALSTGETRVPPGTPNFAGLVRVAAQNYLAQRVTFGGLGDLPPLISEDSGDNEIEADNVRAVAWVYSGYQYEQIRLFDVVDRITELFMNGMLPIGLDSGGIALDKYYWDSEDRLTTAARHSHYSRVLGASGGDVSREVQPNSEFNNLWLRFLSSVAEYDRQYRMADLFQQQRGLATTGEHVRKAGRDLAANASLYGWAATHFVARRLEKQIRDTIDILRLPSVQKAYAVNSPWQVIERVAAMEFGQAPNMVRYDTMARAGKIILDIVANNSRVWSRTTGNPLFDEKDRNGQVIRGGDISETDRMALMTQTQYWLAVNGVKDTEVDQMSQPVASVAAPSIPTAGTDSSPSLDQLRQMVTQGQMPSLDQLQQMVGMNGRNM